MPYYVYILECADGTFYTGSTGDLERRMWEHQQGVMMTAYTFTRRPVKLVWHEEVATYHEALTHEKQIQKWSHAKKDALIRGDWNAIHEIVAAERRRKDKLKRKSESR